MGRHRASTGHGRAAPPRRASSLFDARLCLAGDARRRNIGYGIAESELLPDTLARNRANLEYRRRWAEPQDPQVFDVIASQFRERGLVSTRGPHGLVLEFPLGGGSRSRMFNP